MSALQRVVARAQTPTDSCELQIALHAQNLSICVCVCARNFVCICIQFAREHLRYVSAAAAAAAAAHHLYLSLDELFTVATFVH